jgi:hypothetical protein
MDWTFFEKKLILLGDQLQLGKGINLIFERNQFCSNYYRFQIDLGPQIGILWTKLWSDEHDFLTGQT